ncbi:MAG: hypothetical protein COT74_08200 [Bdellovibrionales bacterium CG10_big_fil_rev_8_21_14_0_10_45_34]|nr:MAG: hypothetical protein COT74_08200 [Bdellovibrionales bacterium CG10_big_fil_rev_8_21_14_0_10_45_34]
MKRLLPVIAGTMLASTFASAQETEFKWNAEMRTRYFSDENRDLNSVKDNQNLIRQRNKLGVSFMKGEDLSGHITILNNIGWGNHATATNAGTPQQNDPNNTAMVHEAWGAWKVNENLSWMMGRRGLDVADQTVVSTNEWEDVPTVFEGAGLIFDYDFGKIALVGVKGAELGNGAPNPNTIGGTSTDAESVYYGIIFDAKNLPDALKIASLHILQKNTDTGAAGNAKENQTRYGITLAGDVSGFDFRGTYAGHTGKVTAPASTTDVDRNASMFDLGLGYTAAEFMNARLGVTYHQDTGDDSTTPNTNEGYDSFHYYRHGNAGMMDYLRWGNLTYFDVAFSIEPWEGGKVGANYLVFSRTSDKGGVFTNTTAGNSTSAVQSTTPTIANGSLKSGEKALGTELDLYVSHNYNNGMDITARYGMFTVGEAIKNGGTIENASQFMLEGKMSF